MQGMVTNFFACRAVDGVAKEWMADRFKMHTNLMSSASFWFDLDEAVGIKILQHFVIGECVAGAAVVWYRGKTMHDIFLNWVAANKMVDSS